MTGKLNKFEVQVIKRTFELPEDTNLEVDDKSLKNAGFCSTLKTVRSDNFNVILKSAPHDKEIRKVIPFQRIFQREIYFYNIVVKAFKQLQNERNVEDVWDCVPKCFYTSNESFKEILVLENLKAQEFLLWPREKEMNTEHVELVLREYARLHALSFAMRWHKPEVLQEIEDNTADIYLPIIERCGTAETIAKLSERVWKALGKDCSLPVVEIMKQLVARGAAGKYGVLCHGDTWCNNILFKYKNFSDHPIAIKFLDFQLARFGSPVLDLSYFLYSSASLKHLSNLNHFLRHYHDSLVKFLKQFDCDASILFPYEVLEDHWKKFAKFGLGMAFLVVNVMMMDDGELPDVTDNGGNGEDFIGSFERKSKNDEKYLEKMVGILRHFEERGLLL